MTHSWEVSGGLPGKVYLLKKRDRCRRKQTLFSARFVVSGCDARSCGNHFDWEGYADILFKQREEGRDWVDDMEDSTWSYLNLELHVIYDGTCPYD